jgi:hypothetical protein
VHPKKSHFLDVPHSVASPAAMPLRTPHARWPAASMQGLAFSSKWEIVFLWVLFQQHGIFFCKLKLLVEYSQSVKIGFHEANITAAFCVSDGSPALDDQSGEIPAPPVADSGRP